MERLRMLAVVFAAFSLQLIVIVAAGAQSGAQVSLSSENASAGDAVRLLVELDTPATCATQANVRFRRLENPTAYFLISGPIRQGQTSATVESRLPLDQPAGAYESDEGYLNPCPNYSNVVLFKIPVRTINVKAFVDPNRYASSGDVTLLPSQRQFFDTKITQLVEIDTQITTDLRGAHSDSRTVRDFLVKMIREADDELSRTELQYKHQILKADEQVPALFADFRSQYAALLIDLGEPITGSRASVADAPRLAYVQLQRRSYEDSAKMAGTYPPSVTAARKVINDNAAAYRYVRNSGRITFDAKITSFPAGAHVRYKKLIDSDYKDYSAPTDIPRVTLELATWDFEFSKDGCTDKPSRRIDPYEDTQPEISVEFRNCKGTR